MKVIAIKVAQKKWKSIEVNTYQVVIAWKQVLFFKGVFLTARRYFHVGYLAGKIVMSMIWAKFWIMISYDGFYVYSAELFPTVVR